MPNVPKVTPEEQLAGDLGMLYADPLGYVMYAFPWDIERSIQMVELKPHFQERFNGTKFGPDEWACDFLDDLAAEIKLRRFDGTNAVMPIQFATSSGHGIGKSTLAAWLAKFILDTRPYSRGVITANTADQLKTKTWAEVGKWHNLSVTKHWFSYSSGRGAMSLTHKEFKENWRCDAQTSREENSEAFAGLHAANSTPFYIFDESSAIANRIFEVREGGTTDGEPMVFDFGNPTRNSGHFFEECKGEISKRIKVRQIDSRNVAITNKARIQQWIDDYGENSDFVKVRVRGEFPSASSLQFIATELVEAAFKKELIVDRFAPLVIGVDVARFGDDETVIYPRIGDDARSFPPKRYSQLDTIQITGQVTGMIREFRKIGMEPSAIFIDGGGGYGGGVVDNLRALGFTVFEVQFGGSPLDKQAYRFKADEMWGNMRDALTAGRLALPDNPDIKSQLTQREFGYTLKQQVNLESKKDMKARGLMSPDIADALALTYAQEVERLDLPIGEARENRTVQHEYDPLEQKW